MGEHKLLNVENKSTPSAPLLPNTTWFIPTIVAELPPQVAQWLLDQGSMTTRLKQHSQLLQINPLFEGYVASTMMDDEINGLSSGHQFWLREVHMVCNHQPWLYCRVVASQVTADDPVLGLKTLGHLPLGQRLFNQPEKPRRVGVQFAMIPWPSAALSAVIAPLGALNTRFPMAHLWARRSRLCWHQHTVVITELFLPDAPLYSCNPPL